MPTKLQLTTKIFVAGHRGLVGSAVCRNLTGRGFTNILTRTRAELDLRNSDKVRSFFESERPEIVVFAAAKVGGIGANSTYPVEFMLENLQMQNNVIPAAADFGTQKLVYLGSSCIYPRQARYPLTEDQFLTSEFEPTNEAYALAKAAGLRLCQYYAKEYGKNFISLMPTNLYGPNDYYDFEKSHVIPSMLLKFIKAKREGAKFVQLWGSGKASREFLHSDDFAEAIFTCIERYDSPEIINVGSEEEMRILDLASFVSQAVGFKGEIQWDSSKPDGVFRKVMNSSKIHALGWRPKRQMSQELKLIAEEVEKRFFSNSAA